MAAPAKKLRSHDNSEILHVGTACDKIPVHQLPTVRDVLCFFFHLNRDVTLSRRDASRGTIQQVYAIWQKTRIPLVQEGKAIGKLERLYKDWREVTKNPGRYSAENDREKKKVLTFTSQLDKLFDISKQDALKTMEISATRAKSETVKSAYLEDIEFMRDQRDGLRLYKIGGVDLKMKLKEKADARRKAVSAARVQKKLVPTCEETDEGNAALNNSDSESTCSELGPSSSSRPVSRGRKDVITPEIVGAIDSANIGCGAAADILSAASARFGVSVRETNINRTTVYRKREKLRAETVNTLKQNFEAESDRVLTVRWDGKRVEALDSVGPSLKADQEREAVVVDGVNTEVFLGAPALPAGNAEAISCAIMKLINEWRLASKVRAAGFDTTSVNSGCSHGVAVKLETALERELLWLPCRHHVQERILESVYRELMGPTSGPEDKIFKDVLSAWRSIDQSKYSTYKDLELTRRHLSDCADEVIKFAKAQILERQPRADYLELLKLIITYLGGQPDNEVQFGQPGPVTSARWMSVALYCLRVALFRKQLQLTKKQLDGILQVVIFVVKVYLQAWFTAPLPVSAPRNDVNLLKDLVAYKNVNKRVAEAATTRLIYHSWYLCETMIGIAVFDEGLPETERQKLAENMLTREGAEHPSRKREEIRLQSVPSMTLSDLATKNSRRFFSILDLKDDFLMHPVSDWISKDDYKEGKEIATHLRVVNDIAERAVKLFKDFNKTRTTKEESFQNLLISVQSHRKSRPDLKKSTLIAKYDK